MINKCKKNKLKNKNYSASALSLKISQNFPIFPIFPSKFKPLEINLTAFTSWKFTFITLKIWRQRIFNQFQTWS